MEKLIGEKVTPTAKLPTRAYEGDAGLDLYADEEVLLLPGQHLSIKTGIKLAIPFGYVGLIWDKGSLAKQGLHTLAGVVDAGYRGEIFVDLINLNTNDYIIKVGQKIAQILIQPVSLCEISEGQVNQTARSDKNLGSSGLY